MLPPERKSEVKKSKTRRVTKRKRSEWWLFLLWLVAMAPIVLQRCSNDNASAPVARVP